MKIAINWAVLLVLCSLSLEAAAKPTCFSGRSPEENGQLSGGDCGCREGRVCVVWMAGGGGATIENFRQRLKDWQTLWSGNIDIITVTPSGGPADMKSYSAADLENAHVIVDACVAAAGTNCHVITSSAAVEPFRRNIFPDLAGKTLGLVIEVQPMGILTKSTRYAAEVNPLAVISLNTKMGYFSRWLFGSNSSEFAKDANYYKLSIYTAELPNVLAIKGVHEGGLSRDETNAMRFIRSLYRQIIMPDGTVDYKQRKEPMALLRNQGNSTILDHGTLAEKLKLLRSLKSDTKAFQQTFEKLADQVKNGRKARENCSRSLRHCGPASKYWSQMALGLYKELISDRPLLAIGGMVDETTRSMSDVTIIDDNSKKVISFKKDEDNDHWFRIHVDGNTSGPYLYYLETSPKETAGEIALKISVKDNSMRIRYGTEPPFIVLEGDPTSKRNKELVTSLRGLKYDRFDIVFVNGRGDLVTVDNELIGKGQEYLPNNVINGKYDARLAVTLWGNIIQVASGRNVIADPVIDITPPTPHRDLSGIDLNIRPLLDTGPTNLSADHILRQRKNGGATWHYLIPEAIQKR